MVISHEIVAEALGSISKYSLTLISDTGYVLVVSTLGPEIQR